ncbi:MAG: DUF368 domain-containing protein [Flavobacterium sp.]
MSLPTLLKKYFPLYLKGMAMGAADVVPGVSGGTIAFISGIYQELIDSIHQINFGLWKVWKQDGLAACWKQANGNFLFFLVAGIATSILSLAKLITYLLHHHAVLLWSFFFGLILASIWMIYQQTNRWKWQEMLAFLASTFFAFYLTIMQPTTSPDSYGFIFLSGFFAIIAMILPGISGAFILLLLGSYEVIIGSLGSLTPLIKAQDWEGLAVVISKLAVFGIGAILGLKAFSGVLHWMFAHYKNITLVVLTGFMVGSLNKIWPWKQVLSTRINSKGEEVPFLEKSILPNHYEGDPQIFGAILYILIGFLAIFMLEKLAKQMHKSS